MFAVSEPFDVGFLGSFDSEYSDNILFVISADYDTNKKNEVHPIHFNYNYYGNEQFNRWLSDNSLICEWYDRATLYVVAKWLT